MQRRPRRFPGTGIKSATQSVYGEAYRFPDAHKTAFPYRLTRYKLLQMTTSPLLIEATQPLM
jgi:hypothetical protein